MPRKEIPIQIVINDKETGASVKFEFEDQAIRKFFYGKKIGDVIEGDAIGFPGYTFQIRGASDIAGFPHIKGLPGIALRQILKSGPPGYRPRKYKKEKKTGGYKIINLKNVKKKKSVRGEELSEWTRQVNMVLLERKGQKIEEMDENSIVNDKLLSELAKKVGKLALRPGFKVLRVTGGDDLEKYLMENGPGEDFFNKLYLKIGIYVLKLGDKKKEVLRLTRYASRKHVDVLSSHIIAKILGYIEKSQAGEIDLSPDETIESIVNDIIGVFESYLKGGLTKRAKISLKSLEL